MNFKEFLYLEEVYQVTVYNGTSIERLPQIMQQGLRIDAKKNWGDPTGVNFRDKSVYLTPTIEIAARYAIGAKKNDTPCIVEVIISTAKRFKKIKYDLMDRPESAWDHEETVDSNAISDVNADIERFVKKWIKINPQQQYYHLKLPNQMEEYGIIGFNGFNLYRFILNEILQQIGQQLFDYHKVRIKTDLSRSFPPGPWMDEIEITVSGTLRVRSSHYKNLGQLQYFKNLPPTAIKYVWVRKSDFPTAKGEMKNFGIEHLPDESKSELEELEDAYRSVESELDALKQDIKHYKKMIALKKSIDKDDLDMDYWASTLQDLIEKLQNDKDNDDVTNDLYNIIEKFKEWELGKQTTEDLDELLEFIETIQENALNYSMNDEWGQSITSHHADWIRVHPSQVMGLLSQPQKLFKFN